MGLFRFHLIGMTQAPLLEIAADTVGDLNELMSRSRFIEGRMTEPDEFGVLSGVLLATSRIQCVIEVCS